MRLSIIIPAYSGEKIIESLFSSIKNELNHDFFFEVLFIFDNGTQLTWQILRDLRSMFPELIKVYRLKKNYGQHRAIQFGLGKANGDFIITMDDDLQHDPADIVKLLKKQKEGNYDVVYGRFDVLRHNGARVLMSNLLRKVLKHFIPTLYEDYSPFRLIKREIAGKASMMVSPYTFIDDFLSRITKNIAFADITHFKRREGRSSYTFSKLFKHGIYILLAYSGFLSWLLFTAGLLIILGILLSILNLISPEATGTTDNMTIIGIFGSGLLLILVSFLGSVINHRNTTANTHPVSYYSEDSF